jgi:hypothetical protein
MTRDRGVEVADRAAIARGTCALSEVQRWLVGADLDGCRRASNGTWTCGLRRNGHAQWVVWNPSGPAELSNPPAWRITRRRDLSEIVRPVPPGAGPIEIGPAPQLLEAAD